MPDLPRPPQSSSFDRFLVSAIAWHTAAWSILFFGMYWIVPKVKKVSMDFDVDLPAVTIITMKISDWIVDYFYLLPFMLVPVLAVDGAVMFWLRQQSGIRFLRGLWFAVMLALPLGILALTAVSLAIPLLDLSFELSG